MDALQTMMNVWAREIFVWNANFIPQPMMNVKEFEIFVWSAGGELYQQDGSLRTFRRLKSSSHDAD